MRKYYYGRVLPDNNMLHVYHYAEENIYRIELYDVQIEKSVHLFKATYPTQKEAVEKGLEDIYNAMVLYHNLQKIREIIV